MIDATMCPACGGPAEVRDRAVLESTDGPIEHAKVVCAGGHWFFLPVADLHPHHFPERSEQGPSNRRAALVARLRAGGRPTRIVLLCSAFNGLSQRAWVELRAAGHEVSIQPAAEDAAVVAAVAAADPDLVICPFLRERVPAKVWRVWPTIVVHPGPKGDRGPSALDWAIMRHEPLWGVTALQAVHEMDAGPIWASRTFRVQQLPIRKSDLYNGAVTDAAMQVIHEVVAKAADPQFVPEPLDYDRPDVWGRHRAPARQADRRFCWSDPSEHIVRRIRAADGSPGVHTTVCGLPVAVYDAHEAVRCPEMSGEPGTVALRRHGAVLIRTGDGGVWVGQLRSRADTPDPDVKLPATTVLANHLSGVAEASDQAGFREISYRRHGHVGSLSFRFYNGAASTEQCHRLRHALRHAAAQDTRVLVLRGGQPFAHGIHLGVIEAASDPASVAWANIVAMDDVCQEIITCTGQLVVCAVASNAGAGGVMLALGADRIVLRDGVVVNPHYQSMGLYGSEYWTYVLPRRVGRQTAHELTTQCQPIGAGEAARIGLADVVIPGDRDRFDGAVLRYAAQLADVREYQAQLAGKRDTRAADEQRQPLLAYRAAELEEMRHDVYRDRHGFAERRRHLITERRAAVSTVGV